MNDFPPGSEPELNTSSGLWPTTMADGSRNAFNDGPTPRIVDLPSLAHTLLFFALAVFILLVGEVLTVAIGQKLPGFRHESLMTLAGDARLMIPAQAIQYALLLAIATLLFSALWHRPFWSAIHWNAASARRQGLPLMGLGLLLGLANGVASNYLPMPKEAPILNDLMHSTSGAWLMFAFGTTGAPLIEELAFRGFLLPSLINAFRWFDRRRRGGMERDAAGAPSFPSGEVAKERQESEPVIGVAVSILLTSIPFALLHSLQVSYAWAPVLLIGLVSVALCVVRVWTRSLAASTLVHATYNFSLFAGMLVASDGFRHLEKLNS